MSQLEINFNNPNFHLENNSESQTHFNRNIDHFTNQCKIVYLEMVKGKRLTTATALINYGIGDLRRRVKDLKDNYNVPIQSEWNKDKGCKEYYLTTKQN